MYDGDDSGEVFVAAPYGVTNPAIRPSTVAPLARPTIPFLADIQDAVREQHLIRVEQGLVPLAPAPPEPEPEETNPTTGAPNRGDIGTMLNESGDLDLDGVERTAV